MRDFTGRMGKPSNAFFPSEVAFLNFFTVSLAAGCSVSTDLIWAAQGFCPVWLVETADPPAVNFFFMFTGELICGLQLAPPLCCQKRIPQRWKDCFAACSISIATAKAVWYLENCKSVVGIWVEMHWASLGELRQAGSAQTESGCTGQ